MRHVTLLDADSVYREELLSILEEINIHYTVEEHYDLSTVYDRSDLVILVCKYELAHMSSVIESVNERFLCVIYDMPAKREPRLMGGLNSIKYIYFYIIYEVDDEMRDDLKLIINGAIESFDRRLGKRLEGLHL
ncbi:hypothetical protein F8S13_21415 [Chloroflexia bacterium SDU3-3]|nr:hypothetical protein F8S13_21415 [Chloroflexia bacterium SDU3-3]